MTRAMSTPPSSPPMVEPVRSRTAPPTAVEVTTSSSPTLPGPDEEALARSVAYKQLAAIKHSLNEAQRVYPHDAGVFVGNLPTGLTPLLLTQEVHNAFSNYGQCWVYTNNGEAENSGAKPWAIVQFRTAFEAQHAIQESGKIKIGKRPTRVSKLEAHRSI